MVHGRRTLVVHGRRALVVHGRTLMVHGRRALVVHGRRALVVHPRALVVHGRALQLPVALSTSAGVCKVSTDLLGLNDSLSHLVDVVSFLEDEFLGVEDPLGHVVDRIDDLVLETNPFLFASQADIQKLGTKVHELVHLVRSTHGREGKHEK